MSARCPAAALLAAALVLFGCGGEAKDRAAAESIAAKVQGQLDNQLFHDVYAQAGDEYRASISEAEFITAADLVRRKLGRRTAVTLRSATVDSGWRRLTMVTLNYQTTFEHGHAGEQFVCRIEDGRATLIGYRIDLK